MTQPKPKSIFTSKTVLYAIAIAYLTEINPMVTRWIETGWHWSYVASAIQAIAIVFFQALIRYYTDQPVYTPDFLPGRDNIS